MKQILFISLLAIVTIFIGACSEQETSTEISLPEAVSMEMQEQQINAQKNTRVTLPSFSALELAKHNFKTDCFVGYDGFVYDVTRWFARETDRVEFKGRVGSVALSQSEYDATQSILLRHCGSVVAFAEEFDRTEITLKKSRAFVTPIGVLN